MAMAADSVGLGSCCPVGPISSQAAREAVVGADPAALVRDLGDGRAGLDAVIETLDCPACVPGLERALAALDGMREARINATRRRLHIVWETERLDLDRILETLGAAGHRIAAFDPKQRDAAVDKESRSLLMAMAVAGFGFANVMLLSVAVWAGLVQDMGEGTRALFHWVSALVALPAIAFAGRPFFGSAIAALRSGAMNMDVPIALAVTLAAGMSLFETTRNGPHVYYDAALGLLFFLLIGRFLDRNLRGRAFQAAEDLLALRAVTAQVVRADGAVEARPIDQVRAGDRVAVSLGMTVPVDGVVVAGRSEIDESLVTGETLPRPIAEGDTVNAGTLNLGAPITVETRAAGESTLLSEITRMMDQAGQRKARYVRFADRVARIYAPAVHAVALAAFVGWVAVGGLDWRSALMVAVAVLIVTCPCALGLAVPAVQVGAVGRLLRRGLYVKSGDALERLAEADLVVFDKTGTLTLGRPDLVETVGGDDRDRALSASLARWSSHPLAAALVRGTGSVEPIALTEIREEPGNGIRARTVEGREIRLGRADWVADQQADRATPEAGPALWFSVDGEIRFRALFADRPRSDAAETVRALTERGIEVRLLSGDRAPAVSALAREVGILGWKAECRPDDKIALIEALRAEGRKVAMVGDGLNDAPSLAAAHVSISPSTAADVSQTAADLVFRGEGLGGIVEALDVSRRSGRLVRQNVGLALCYNAIAIPLATLGLVTPLIAAIAMSASSIVVTANALRVQRGR